MTIPLVACMLLRQCAPWSLVLSDGVSPLKFTFGGPIFTFLHIGAGSPACLAVIRQVFFASVGGACPLPQSQYTGRVVFVVRLVAAPLRPWYPLQAWSPAEKTGTFPAASISVLDQLCTHLTTLQCLPGLPHWASFPS